MIWILFLLMLGSFGDAVICPGGEHKCPKTLFSESTCCELADGSYGCCPHPNATCCDDHIHCCSQGYVCLKNGDCVTKGQDISADNQIFLSRLGIVCPDKEHRCPNRSTCCKLKDKSEYGCCPMPNAVCCSDGEHCCPQGSQCDLVKQMCISKKNGALVKSKKWHTIEALTLANEGKSLSNIICEGGQYQCPDSYTCCKLPSGKWGCCPFTNATCCNDHLHCCPEGMLCDPGSQSCHQGDKSVTWFNNKPATLVENLSSIICEGGEYQCPDSSTCCKLPSGKWGCCPFTSATCCNDHEHCCPEGMKCDSSSQSCHQGNKNVTWFNNKPATLVENLFSTPCEGREYQRADRNKQATLVENSEYNICHDRKLCPGYQTCCPSWGGGFFCCSFPNAGCCPGSNRCCPSNTKCCPNQANCCRSDYICNNAAECLPPGNTCPDGMPCPGQCCPIRGSGRYGCCPYVNPVCCSDGSHCCPPNTNCCPNSLNCCRSDYICNEAAQCLPPRAGMKSIPWLNSTIN